MAFGYSQPEGAVGGSASQPDGTPAGAATTSTGGGGTGAGAGAAAASHPSAATGAVHRKTKIC